MATYTDLTRIERARIMDATNAALLNRSNYDDNGEVIWNNIDANVFMDCGPKNVEAHYDFWDRYVDCILEAKNLKNS
jgi:hypothetical protein